MCKLASESFVGIKARGIFRICQESKFFASIKTSELICACQNMCLIIMVRYPRRMQNKWIFAVVKASEWFCSSQSKWMICSSQRKWMVCSSQSKWMILQVSLHIQNRSLQFAGFIEKTLPSFTQKNIYWSEIWYTLKNFFWRKLNSTYVTDNYECLFWFVFHRVASEL